MEDEDIMINNINVNVFVNSETPTMLSLETMNKINDLIKKDLKKIKNEEKKKHKEYIKYLNEYLKNKKQIVITI